jgi:hypothetical protein
MFEAELNKWEKKTGPTTSTLDAFLNSQKLSSQLDLFLKEHLSEKFKIIGGNFYYSKKPYLIHTDGEHLVSTRQRKLFNIIIPIYFKGEMNSSPEIVVFNQTFSGPPTKFILNEVNVTFPQTSYPYKCDNIGIEGLTSNGFEAVPDFLDHLKKGWLKNFSIFRRVNWTPGEIIVFPSKHLHCSASFDFTKTKEKLGLSIFVEIF